MAGIAAMVSVATCVMDSERCEMAPSDGLIRLAFWANAWHAANSHEYQKNMNPDCRFRLEG